MILMQTWAVNPKQDQVCFFIMVLVSRAKRVVQAANAAMVPGMATALFAHLEQALQQIDWLQQGLLKNRQGAPSTSGASHEPGDLSKPNLIPFRDLKIPDIIYITKTILHCY